MVARRLLLLVGVFMLLIDNDQPERMNRSEHRRSGSDHDARPALPDFVPLIMSLTAREVRMQHRHKGSMGA